MDCDTGFYLSNGAMRNPDATWISKEKMATIPKTELDSFPYLCPDFIIKLKSKLRSLADLKIKMHDWMENGCQLEWLIDADEEIMYLYEHGVTSRTHTDFDTLLWGSSTLLGF